MSLDALLLLYMQNVTEQPNQQSWRENQEKALNAKSNQANRRKPTEIETERTRF